jgi:protocatechuate 3,4-dioxygenase beta subunit
MRSVLLSSAVVLTAAITLSAQAKSPQPSQSKKELCTVAGRVVTAAEGNPLKSAHVMLMEQNAAREPKTYGATTDASGIFILKSVAPGRYKIFDEHTGYVRQQYHSQDADTGAVLALQPQQQAADILFRLTPAAVITGHVTDEDQEPMAGIQVLALRRRSEEETEDEDVSAYRKQDQMFPAGSAQTDDRGVYRIFGLQPGDYYLRATQAMQSPLYSPGGEEYFALQSQGTEYAPVYYPGVLQRTQAETVTLRPGDEAQIDFTMRHVKTVEISGRVLGPDGKPANTMVELGETDDYSDSRNTNTDEQGKFRLKGVPPGSYILRAYQQGKDNVYRPAARQELQVGSDNIDSLILALARGTDLTGRVRVEGSSGAPPDRVHVSLREVGGIIGGYGARAKPDGSFEIKSVPEGNYAVMVGAGGEGVWYVKSARLGSDDVLAHGLQVEKGTAGTLDIVIGVASAQLAGSVMEDDKPAIGARVRVFPDPETPYNRTRRRSTTTDQNGQFVASGIAPGKYRVTARSPADPAGAVAVAEPQFVTLGERERKAVQLILSTVQNR